MILVCLSHAFKKCPEFFFQFKQLINGLLPWLWLITCLVTDTSFTDLDGFGWKLRDPLFFAYFKRLLIHSYTPLHMKCLSYPFQNYKHVLFLTFAASILQTNHSRNSWHFFIPQKSGCFFRSKKSPSKTHGGGNPVESHPSGPPQLGKGGRSAAPNPLAHRGPGPFTSL